jgi:hypothetical protein
MTKKATILTLGLLLVVSVGVALAGEHGKGKTIEGTLVDTKCYSMNAKNVTNDHVTPKGTMPNCATACAKIGIPAALLTADGKVYTLAVPAGQVADHMAKTARATGMVKQGVIVAEKLEVKEGGSWKEVNLATMM